MGVHNLPTITTELQTGGLSGDTSIALIPWGTWAQQEELFGTLDTTVEAVTLTQFGTPAIAVIGAVVNLHEILPSYHPIPC